MLQMFRLCLRLVAALVLLAGRSLAQQEVEFSSPDNSEAAVDSQDVGDLSYDSQVRTSLLHSHWSSSNQARLSLVESFRSLSNLMP